VGRAQTQSLDDGWAWVREGARAAGGCLTFGRDVTAERVLEAFGMNPADALVLPEAEADRALRFPVFDEPGRRGCPWLRAGRVGDWAFAIEEISLQGYLGDAGKRLSAGTEAVVVSWTPKINYAHYLADGEEVISFDPDLAHIRYGSDPDRFLAQMRAAGLDTEPARDDDEVLPEGDMDPVIATLDMFTLALGIRLPASTSEGPLLTVQRRPG
jgi:hypothetical protein